MTYSTSASSAQALAGQAIAVRVTGDPDPTNNGLFYLHNDHLGSVSAMSDGNGNLVPTSTARYMPFGDWRTEPGTNPMITDRGYTGHAHNNSGANDLGLIYMNARYYVPYLNRFISADTIVPNPANPQSFNRYSYTRNNPLNLIDPTGHRDCELDGQCDPSVSLPPYPRYIVGENEAGDIFDDMADEQDIPFAFPADGCYDRASDMAERISNIYNIAETHILKVFIYGNLEIETEYVYPDINGEEIVWRYHVAPAILVDPEDQGAIWMIIDPSIMGDVATLSEWKNAMNDPDAWFDFQNMDAYWPNNLPIFGSVPEGYDVNYGDVSSGKPIGGPMVDDYHTLCVAEGYCQP